MCEICYEEYMPMSYKTDQILHILQMWKWRRLKKHVNDIASEKLLSQHFSAAIMDF